MCTNSVSSNLCTHKFVNSYANVYGQMTQIIDPPRINNAHVYKKYVLCWKQMGTIIYWSDWCENNYHDLIVYCGEGQHRKSHKY